MKVFKSEILNNFFDLTHGFIYDFEKSDFELVSEKHGLNKIHSLKQIHSDKIFLLEDIERQPNLNEGDCLISRTKKVGVSVVTADCVPILVYERLSGVVSAIHAGWRGTLNEITAACIKKIKEISNLSNFDFAAVIGPAIGKCCYEVDYDVASKFISKFGGDNFFLTRLDSGKFILDLVYLNRHQLESMGVKKIDVLDSCTKCDKLLPSYRRDGKDAGRMLSFIGLL
ncbi:MAG: peptidoglycan editing factor PgeF [Thermodesulfobacteriota bacterium]